MKEILFKRNNKRVHLVNLFKWRSAIAFFACLLTINISLGSVAYGIITEPDIKAVQGEFEWFTIDSNLLTAFAALMILPFTIEGIRKKRLVYPKWLLLIHYAGTICASLTHIFVMAFISWYDWELAFGNENIFLHIICPIAVTISFFMVEADYRLSLKDVFIGMIPFSIYVFLYLLNVVVFKTWEDHYLLNTVIPYYISMPGMFLLTFLIGLIIRSIHNYLLGYREKKMKLIWDEKLDPVSIKIEIFSLGYHAGLHQNKSGISVPFDILEDIAKTFNMKIDELSRAYIKGAIIALKERDE